jgi:succinoglycan biosynthesis transport protein ExoP
MSDSNFLPGPSYRNGTASSRNGKSHSGEVVPRQYFDAPPPAAQGPEEAENDGLITYWRILRRHKATLIVAATLGAIAGVLITIPQTPVYQSTVAIEIQSINDDFLNLRNMNQTSSSSWDPSYDIQTQVRAMQSRVLMERVAKAMNSVDPAALIVGSKRLAGWRKVLHLSEPKPPSIEDAVAQASVKIKPSISSRIVEITCDSVNPNVAAQFANTVATEYIKENMESRWNATQKTGEFLTRQIQDLKIKLEQSEDELQRYMNTAGLMFIQGEKEKENVAEEKLRKLQEEVLRAEADRVTKQSQAELIKNVPTDSLPEMMEDRTLADYQAKLTELRRQMADLNISLTPSHPKVEKLQAQIDTLETALKKSRSDIIQRVTNEYQAALNREKLLDIQFGLQKNLVSDQAAKVIHYNILKREVDTNRQIYEAMLQRVKESGIVSAMRASGIRIVDPAIPPSEPYKPSIPRSAAAGLVVGMFLGVAIVFIQERSNRNLQQPGDAAFYLNIPELGVIPTANTDPKKGVKAGPDDGALLIRPEMDPVELVTWNRKFSVLAEAFRTTLTSLLFSGQNGDQPRLIVLTSANPSEGKTTVTINLAIALAEINRRVLLIDADMRRPRLQNLFDLGPGPGLADLLRERTPEDTLSLDRVVCPTAIPGLYIMRSGRSSGVVSNLLHSARLPELLQQLRNEFDTVVIDTPPALHISDARVIGRLADAVLLIVRAGQTSRDAAQMVKQRFGEDGTPLLGTILNGWDPKHDVYGYKYRYYNGNGSSYSQKEITSDQDKA